jgi:hypothetical protein
MDFTKMKRDPDYIKSNLVLAKDGSYFSKKAITLVIPKRFEEKGMVVVAKDALVIGYFAMVIDNKYSVSKISSMVPIGPSLLNIVKINGEDYYTFSFKPFDTVITYYRLVQNNQLPYSILDEIVNRGNIPAYFNYLDVGTVLDSAKYYSNTNYSERQDVIQLIVSLLARNKANVDEYYRHVVKDFDMATKVDPEYVSVYSVTYAANSTMSKLLGAYFSEGVNSSLITDNTEVDKVEELIRA